MLFSGSLADNTYANSKRNECSGHTSTGKKAWLSGLYFEDTTIDVSQLTNTELATILDPTSDTYRDYINYVYEDSNWSWCDGFNDWFSSTPTTTTTTTSTTSSSSSSSSTSNINNNNSKSSTTKDTTTKSTTTTSDTTSHGDTKATTKSNDAKKQSTTDSVTPTTR